MEPDGTDTASYSWASRWFVRLMAFIYFFAFLTLAQQARGLIGENGILPAASWLEAVHRQLGLSAWWQAPTLFWFDSSDAMLVGVSWAGVILSVLLAAGMAPGLISFLLWWLYLSIVSVGQDFFSFQWDALQLEMGFLLIFLAPWRWWTGWKEAINPPAVARWLFWFLLFRFMIFQGVVKLLSGDESWRDLMALTYHYETQPLPSPLAWRMHHWPVTMQRISCGLMFVIELGLPCLIWIRGWPRRIAAGGLIFLQVMIMLSGNHAYFNWQSLAMCALLIEDRDVPWLRWQEIMVLAEDKIQRYASWGLAGLIGVLTLLLYTGGSWFDSWRLVNHYGAFAVMTKSRPEIIIEGSADGSNWVPCEFKWKVGDINRSPSWNAPYHPRLDWQMWFLGLGAPRVPAWYENFLVRLLQGKPEVRALLRPGAFEQEPPKYIRSWIYDYHFTRPGEEGWWKRELIGVYFQQVSLR